MERRDFLTTAGIGAAASVLAAPAIAQSAPQIKWRCTSSFPKSLDTIFATSEAVAKRVAEMTDNKFQIQMFAANEIVPGLAAADAVSNKTVEMAHTATYYYVGKDPAFAIPCCIPFGLNARQQNAWLYEGGGGELANEFFKKYNFIGFPCGNTGAQMGGWFRKEIKSVADLQNLKFRIAGIAGQISAKLGVVPQQTAGGEIYPALEKGTIDGAEWVGPYDDEKLGFSKIAPYYYYPAWWEGGPTLHMLVNLESWAELPASYKAAIQAATAEGNQMMLAKYDRLNPQALKRLVAAGTRLLPFPDDVMEASFKAAEEVYADLSAKNADFKKMYEALKEFRGEEVLWFQFAEGFFDRFMFQLQRRKAI